MKTKTFIGEKEFTKRFIMEKIDECHIELCKEFSNTPIDERKSSWNWIGRYRSKLLDIFQKNEKNI